LQLRIIVQPVQRHRQSGGDPQSTHPGVRASHDIFTSCQLS